MEIEKQINSQLGIYHLGYLSHEHIESTVNCCCTLDKHEQNNYINTKSTLFEEKSFCVRKSSSVWRNQSILHVRINTN